MEPQPKAASAGPRPAQARKPGGAARKAGVVSFPGMATASFQTFSPDGRIAAFSDFNNALLLVSVPSGKVIQDVYKRQAYESAASPAVGS